MIRTRGLAALTALGLLGACASTGTHEIAGPAAISHPEGAVFDPSLDAHAAVDAALESARTNNTRVLLVMGANWCHDSRALTSYLMEPELADLLEASYEVVYIDVGLPQTGDGFNLDIAERFGVTSEGTPNVLVLDADGGLLNSQEDATSWRNSASRTSSDVLATLQGWAAS
ncbi:thioredoxin family protein [Aurantiacibacter zhengii]|uniref:Thioredoxin family protein n=1 Tax=Aurantiacibacter zhengii TaxID=2307003 RepID=A0A418NQU6_9SPHN|nr:thioredoxin family protein [Aurantiacibacter zhengii]RIV85120.1 thioredoxin family protein [Aurantiacibacter zhengii]